MINQLRIQRFKSVKELNLPCRKVNVFIGEPDSGKTNILESLEFVSCLQIGADLGLALRLSKELGFGNLFFKSYYDKPILINMDEGQVEATLVQNDALHVKVAGRGNASEATVGMGGHAVTAAFNWLKYYAYTSAQQWTYSSGGQSQANMVQPPGGPNLLFVAQHNERVKAHLKELVAQAGFKLRFDNYAKRMYVVHERDDEIFNYSLELLSDSLKRMFFYAAILLTSRDSTLVLDEPDVCAFPPFPKSLGEMIAGDDANQFFLTTHNPYFLSALVEKTPSASLALFVCRRDEEGATRAVLLDEKQVQQVIEQGASVFFNLDEITR